MYTGQLRAAREAEAKSAIKRPRRRPRKTPIVERDKEDESIELEAPSDTSEA